MDEISFEFACRDDCLDKMVPSDLRRVVRERDSLRAEIARLTAEVERLEAERRWIPVTERMPDAGVHVYAAYKNTHGQWRQVRAFWVPKFWLEQPEGPEATFASDYDETTDNFYWQEGWYEVIDNWDDYSAIRICDAVSDWMPSLPMPTQAQGE